MAFSEDELSRILQYLGYPKQLATEQSMSNGLRLNSPSLDYLYTALQRLSPEGEARCREDLCQLAQIDGELSKLRSKMALESTGDVKFNAKHGRALLLSERWRMVNQLADDLGAPPNPLSHQRGPRVVNT